MIKRILALALALAMLLTTAVVFAEEKADVYSELSGELTVWVRAGTSGPDALKGIWGNEPGDAYYDYLSDTFPNVKFTFVMNKGWDGIPEAAAASNAPDVFFWEGDPNEMTVTLTQRGLAENLTPYIEADESFVNNFSQALLEAHSIDGALYGLPFDVMPYGIFVNYDVLDKANVDYPSMDWTMEEFMQICKDVTNKSDPANTTIAIARNVIENDYVRFLNMFLSAYGVKTYGVDENGKKYSNLSEDPAAITAFEKYLEIQANNYAYTLSAEERNVMGLDNSVWDIDWEAGVAAFFPGVSSWAYLTTNGEPTYNQVFYPAFAGPEGCGATLNTISYSIYAGSQNKELAWEFLKAMTSEEYRNNAYAEDPESGEIVHNFVYDEDTTGFASYGIPPFTTEYELNEEFAKIFEGLQKAMDYPYTSYVRQFELLEATRKVARGEAQLVDALKEYDDFVNSNNLITY